MFAVSNKFNIEGKKILQRCLALKMEMLLAAN
jgi:hypothetical protein